jgi:hypothetical protein
MEEPIAALHEYRHARGMDASYSRAKRNVARLEASLGDAAPAAPAASQPSSQPSPAATAAAPPPKPPPNSGISSYELGRSWKAVPWRDILANKPGAKAEYYFMRSGLIRKDILPLYANASLSTAAEGEVDAVPATFLVSSYDELTEVLRKQAELQKGSSGSSADHLWVLKLTDSSNAFGMRFFSQSDPSTVREDVDEDTTVRADGMAKANEKRVIQRYVPPLLLQVKLTTNHNPLAGN